MKYATVWLRTALDQLAAAWVASTDRQGVTAASHWQEEQLSLRPLTLGESRGTSVVRIAYAPPLGIEFEVIEDDKKVRILRVWSLV